MADVLIAVALTGVVLLGALVVAQGRALRRHRLRYRAAFAGTDASALLDAVRQQADELDELRARLDALATPSATTDVDASHDPALPAAAEDGAGATDAAGRGDLVSDGGAAAPAERPAVDRMAVVRYDAFPSGNGAGPSLSFSLALLDQQLDGVVLTGITGRSESRVYCKAVTDGRGEQTLSDEEEAAIDAAAAGDKVVLVEPAGSPPDGERRTLRGRTA